MAARPPVAQPRRSSDFCAGRPVEGQNCGRGVYISTELGRVPRRATVFSAGRDQIFGGVARGRADFRRGETKFSAG